MSRSVTRARRRSPLWEDVAIVLLGVWGFVLQSVRTLFAKETSAHD